MRRKKHKQTRRAVAFYRLNFGFHEPYKVLLDGNFIHAAISSNLVDLGHHLGSLLGGRLKLYVTRCVTRELQDMGADTAAALKAARGLELHKCGHERGQCTAGDCLKEQIGMDNPGRWWVATQDTALRTHLEQVPACPLVFATINGIHMHEPPTMARSTAKQASTTQQALPKHELTSYALKGLEQLHTGIRTNVRFRKHKAKGPNPLSVRRKKQTKIPGTAQKGAADASKPTGDQLAADGAAAGVKRRRKHASKSTAVQAGHVTASEA